MEKISTSKHAYDGEVAVIGLGAMGSFTFWQLAKMGIDVFGFDQFSPPHDKGEAHGESRIFRTAYGEGVEYVPLLQEARNLWRELETEAGIELYNEIGCLMFGTGGDDFFANVWKSIEDYQLPVTSMNREEAKRQLPQINFQENERGILENHAGYLKPEKAIEAAMNRGRALGGKAFTNTEVQAIEANQDSVVIKTKAKDYRFAKAVVAAGGWTKQLLPQLKLPFHVERQVLLWYEPENIEAFLPENFPVYANVNNDPLFYGFPTLDRKTIKIAFHHGGQVLNHPDEVDRTVHESDLLGMNAVVKKYFPGVKPQPVKSQVCFYTNTPDEHFVLGPVAGLPNVTLLGPMSGHGFKFAPVMGKLAAELATGKTVKLPIELFHPSRFMDASFGL